MHERLGVKSFPMTIGGRETGWLPLVPGKCQLTEDLWLLLNTIEDYQMVASRGS